MEGPIVEARTQHIEFCVSGFPRFTSGSPSSLSAVTRFGASIAENKSKYCPLGPVVGTTFVGTR